MLSLRSYRYVESSVMDTSQSAVIKRLNFKMCRVFQTLMGKAPVEYPPPPTLKKRTKKCRWSNGGKSSRYLAKSHFHVAFAVPTTPPLRTDRRGTLRKTCLHKGVKPVTVTLVTMVKGGRQHKGAQRGAGELNCGRCIDGVVYNYKKQRNVYVVIRCGHT